MLHHEHIADLEKNQRLPRYQIEIPYYFYVQTAAEYRLANRIPAKGIHVRHNACDTFITTEIKSSDHQTP